MAHDSLHAFDFLQGACRVAHRRLKERLAGCTAWEEFAGTCTMRTILGGAGNMDDNWLDLPGGAYRAVTFRSYDAASRAWAIWWLDARTPHALEPPVIGGFADGVGLFYCDDTLRGRPIKVRFRWFDITPVSARWEQAYSGDGGASWEVNWEMAFTRAG